MPLVFCQTVEKKNTQNCRNIDLHLQLNPPFLEKEKTTIYLLNYIPTLTDALFWLPTLSRRPMSSSSPNFERSCPDRAIWTSMLSTIRPFSGFPSIKVFTEARKLHKILLAQTNRKVSDKSTIFPVFSDQSENLSCLLVQEFFGNSTFHCRSSLATHHDWIEQITFIGTADILTSGSCRLIQNLRQDGIFHVIHFSLSFFSSLLLIWIWLPLACCRSTLNTQNSDSE